MKPWINAADRCAIGLSLLCTIHCLVLPIVLILTPTVTGILAFDDELFHEWLLFAVLPISLFAVIAGFIHHRNFSVTVISSVGMSMLIVAAVLGHDVLNEVGEVALTVLGSLFIAFGHLRNLQLRRRDTSITTEH